MALIFYGGSGGAGKSLFAVALEIFPALVAGRRVITSIEGMGDPERQEKLFKLVRAAGGPEAPDFHFVGHSEFQKAGLSLWPKDMQRELDDGTRVFDDTSSVIKFGSLVVWDEATAFTTTKLSHEWEQAVTYHRHWGLPDKPFDIVILHQSFKNLNVLVRDMVQTAYVFGPTAKPDKSVRAMFKRPGEKVALKMDDKDALKEPMPHPKQFYGTYKSHIADGEHKDTKLPSIWASNWFRKKMILIGGLLALSIGGAVYMKQGSLFQQYGPGGQLAKVGSVNGAPPAGGSALAGGGAVQFVDETQPTIVGSVPGAGGEWLALVRDGGRFVEVKAPAGVVRYKGKVLSWPDGY